MGIGYGAGAGADRRRSSVLPPAHLRGVCWAVLLFSSASFALLHLRNGMLQSPSQQQRLVTLGGWGAVGSGCRLPGRGGSASKAACMPPRPLQHPLHWFAPIWSGSGYGTEAINYVLSLQRSGLVAQGDVWVTDYGGARSAAAAAAMPPADLFDLCSAEAAPAADVATGRNRTAIAVCHSMPYFWAPRGIQQLWSSSVPCPPPNAAYAIGRTMYETDRVTADFAARCNAMDEVWVPTEWHRDVFAKSGVSAAKLRVVPEGVNTTHFDPALHAPLDLSSRAKLVFAAGAAAAGGEHEGGTAAPQGGRRRLVAGRGLPPLAQAEEGGETRPFRFISSFKWETRKGWDVLLGSYLDTFTADDPVELYLLTKPWEGGQEGLETQMQQWAARKLKHPTATTRQAADTGANTAADTADAATAARRGAARRLAAAIQYWALEREQQRQQAVMEQQQHMGHGGRRRLVADGAAAAEGAGAGGQEGGEEGPPLLPEARRLPTLYVIDTHINDTEFPGFYAAGDAFVLSTRGEGWGRPIVEAMSMGLPVIATNWSGPTAFLTEETGYPLAIDGLTQATGWPAGLQWAVPSAKHLSTLMRRVAARRAEGAARGRAARALMVDQFSPPAIARVLFSEIRRVEGEIERRRREAERRAQQLKQRSALWGG